MAPHRERLQSLFPIDRTLVGSGAARFLDALGRELPLHVHRFPTGSRCFDWTVPPAWELERATVVDGSGGVIADTRDTVLSVVNYSEPFRGRLSKAELLPRLHTSESLPAAIPYRTSYYTRTWGFCVPQAVVNGLDHDVYDVEIDARHVPGDLQVGEVRLPGKVDREVVLLSYVCHPRQANDGLSGVVALMDLVERMAAVPRFYTYRFLFLPETIGSLAMCASGLLDRRKIEYAVVATCLGVGKELTFKRTAGGDHSLDHLAAELLTDWPEPGACRDYWPHGSDERQLSSPGVQIPTASLMRTPYGEFPEYHTSADDLSLVDETLLAGAADFLFALLCTYDHRPRVRGTVAGGEPFLSRHGLYQTLGGPTHGDDQLVRNWVLHLADGRWSAEDIARRSGMPLARVREHVRVLEAAGLLEPRG
jgi:aminopeptidase-like protein